MKEPFWQQQQREGVRAFCAHLAALGWTEGELQTRINAHEQAIARHTDAQCRDTDRLRRLTGGGLWRRAVQ